MPPRRAGILAAGALNELLAAHGPNPRPHVMPRMRTGDAPEPAARVKCFMFLVVNIDQIPMHDRIAKRRLMTRSANLDTSSPLVFGQLRYVCDHPEQLLRTCQVWSGP